MFFRNKGFLNFKKCKINKNHSHNEGLWEKNVINF